MAKELERVTEDGEIVSGLPVGYGEGNMSLAVSLARAEVDQQIATARAMPRSVNRAVQNIMTLATLDEESAEECVYALPRGGKPIKGPSVRLAEIIASQWGNCRVGARVVHVDRVEKYVEAEGVFHDLETNTATTARVRRRISDKNGRLLNDDMIVVTGNAACAIAKRNAILGAVPKGVWRKAYSAVESVIAGDVKTLVERRAGAMKAFAAFGVKPEEVFAAVGVTGLDDITLEHMPTLLGMHSALKSGEANVEEMFRKTVDNGKPGEKKPLSEKLADIANDGRKEPAKDEKEAKTSSPATEKEAPKEEPRREEPRRDDPIVDDMPADDDADGEEAGDASGDPEDDDTFPGDRPSSIVDDDAGADPAPNDLAFARGQKDKRAGMSRKAVPTDYRSDPELSAAWVRGWESVAANSERTR